MTVPEVLPMPENLAESPRPYFNPRLPDGRRPIMATPGFTDSIFQSTPPGWEATVKMDTPFHDMERIFILVINRTALY